MQIPLANSKFKTTPDPRWDNKSQMKNSTGTENWYRTWAGPASWKSKQARSGFPDCELPGCEFSDRNCCPDQNWDFILEMNCALELANAMVQYLGPYQVIMPPQFWTTWVRYAWPDLNLIINYNNGNDLRIHLGNTSWNCSVSSLDNTWLYFPPERIWVYNQSLPQVSLDLCTRVQQRGGDRVTAFAMATHSRLGADSLFRNVSDELLQIIGKRMLPML